MFDVKMLDRLNFGQLGEMLGHIIEQMKELKAETPEGKDDPRHDMLLVVANQIIVRMDSIARDNLTDSPELLDQWKKASEPYQKTFKDYVRTHLKDGVPLVMAEPEAPSKADAKAEWLAKLDALVLDEKQLEGMNAGELFELNGFIIERVQQLDKELPEEVADPIIKKLLKFGDLVFRRLDPLVREAYSDKPEKLAGWMAIVNDYEKLDDLSDEDDGADVRSTEVS